MRPRSRKQVCYEGYESANERLQHIQQQLNTVLVACYSLHINGDSQQTNLSQRRRDEMTFAMRIKGIELYSQSEARLELRGDRGTSAIIYVPIETVGEYKLGQEFELQGVDHAA